MFDVFEEENTSKKIKKEGESKKQAKKRNRIEKDNEVSE
jgi:ATP-dependent RNA helicase DOB1